MHMDVVHDPERVKGYETLLARRHQDVCLRDPSKAKVSLSPNLGDLCGRRAVQGQTSSARTDGIIVTYIDEHVIGDDEKHKDAGLGRFGDGQKLPPKIIVFDPGIDLCGSRAENGSYTPTSTQLSIAYCRMRGGDLAIRQARDTVAACSHNSTIWHNDGHNNGHNEME